jgi:hypothetical protein
MSRIITNLLTILLISPLILPTTIEAQPTNASPINASNQNRDRISPFDLTYLAYQGNLKDRGIPSYGALIDAIAFGRVTAQKVMQAAVRANLLPEQTLSDSSYRSALQTQLYNLVVTD